METRDIKDFFRELKDTRLYQDINPLDLDNEQAQLKEITDIVDEFVLERFLETFPCADPHVKELVKGLPYEKAYSMLTEHSKMPWKERSVKKLMREVVAASEQYTPKWHKEEGRRYLEDSHINKFLNI